MNLVKLSNGESVPEPLAKTAYSLLRNLLASDPIGFYELVEICRNESHVLFGDYTKKLSDLGLISDGKPNDIIKIIVLASSEGEGLGLKLVSPFQEPQINSRDDVSISDLNDFELFKLMHRVADIVFEYCVDYTGCEASFNKRTLPQKEDWRKDDCNPYYNQTNGLFLEFYYGTPSSIWTPWGTWKFSGSGSGSGSWNAEIEPGKSSIDKVLERTGAVIFIEEQETSMGCFGPVYSLHHVDGVQLPTPNKISRDKFNSHEDIKAAWKELSEQL